MCGACRWTGNGPANCPSVYSFSYGNVAVLSLDANDVSYEITANTGYSGGAQNGWAERQLATRGGDPATAHDDRAVVQRASLAEERPQQER